MGEPDRIEVVFREDADARLAALDWFQKAAAPQWELSIARALPLAAVAVLGGLVAVPLIFGLGLPPQLALALAAMTMVIVAYGWAVWSRALARRISGAFDPDAWGDVRYRFDRDGFDLDDALRHWHTGWRGVSMVSAEPKGLYLATKGMVFYLPAGCWPDRAAMQTDAARIEGWRCGTGAPS